MRFERSALFAHENNYDTFATTLGISRWKDLEQINASGLKAANRYNDLDFWDFNWRNKAVLHVCWKFLNKRNFINKNIVDAFTV